MKHHEIESIRRMLDEHRQATVELGRKGVHAREDLVEERKAVDAVRNLW